MKSSRFLFEYRASASSLHKEVGDILRTHPLFSGYSSFQEYPVNKVDPSFRNGSYHYDWAIPQLRLVIEIMGRQHETPTDFSGKLEGHQVLENFQALKSRDKLKKEAALRAGYIYLEVPYSMKDKLDGNKLYSLYKEADYDYEPEDVQPVVRGSEPSDYQNRMKDKAKAWRKKQNKKARMQKRSGDGGY